jgi:hypothetical protein
VVRTGSEVFDDLLVEAVVSPDDPHRLCLEIWEGGRATTMNRVGHHGVTYVAPPMVPGLMQAVRFSPASKPFPSAGELVACLRQFFIRYAFLLPDALDVLVAFVLASWFIDCTAHAPILYIVGPETTVRLVLRLAGCMCRRPALVGDVDRAALATLPAGLGTTLLMDQRQLSCGMSRVLLASTQRDFYVARGRRCLDVYGARAFSCDARPANGDDIGLRVFLAPTPNPLPILTDAAARAAREDFQAQLLRYRMVYHTQVSCAEVDCSRFVPGMREQALTWLAPICDCAELRQSVLEALSRQSREAAGERFSDLKCIAIESALVFCHREGVQHFLVGEAADVMNLLLQGRHEDSKVSPKKAGSLLGDVGIFGDRVTKGYKITLTGAVRERIHQLARAFQVVAMRDAVSGCGHCSKAGIP